MRIEAGKYYVDGEGFYHCLGEYPDRIHLRMEMATISKPIGLYIALACCCERRMVECSEEQYKKARDLILEAKNQLDEYNSEVFHPLWEARKKEEERWLSRAEVAETWKKVAEAWKKERE